MTDTLELNYGQIFFMTLGFLPVLACLPCWIVAKFIYMPYVKQLKEENEYSADDVIPFEYLYPIEEAKNNKDISGEFTNCIVLSNTPKGMVYMRYHKQDEGFEYWSDNVIDYKYLETVARKYVTIFCCRDLYIDRMSLLRNKINYLKQQIKENKTKLEENNVVKNNDKGGENDVFASFKNYNKSNKEENIKTKTKITKDDMVCDTANKYIHRGKISDITDSIFNVKPKKKEMPTSSMSFSSWKLWKSNEDKKDKNI